MMRTRHRLLWLLLALLALAGCASRSRTAHSGARQLDPHAGETDRSRLPEEEFDRVLVSDDVQRPFHGVAAIADGSQLVYRKVEGYADREHSVPLTLESRFVIGSLSKQFTAVLVLQLVDRQLVDLDASIGTYLGLEAPWASTVKVRHLLNHTSGLVDLDSPIQSEPGTTFAYSNLGYDLLGALVERVSKQSYATVATHLFTFCGMTHSAVLPLSEGAELVEGYDEKNDGSLAVAPQQEASHHAPSGGIVSSAEDLVRWNLCLHEKHPIAASSYEAMISPSTVRSHRWGSLGYGFGLQVSRQDGIAEYSHSGYLPGFIATMTFYPQWRRTLIVLENISWMVDDMQRVFLPHDRLREAMRSRMDLSSSMTKAVPGLGHGVWAVTEPKHTLRI